MLQLTDLGRATSTEKSNQSNLGTIKSSNLCTEIIEYSAPDEWCAGRFSRFLRLPADSS